MDGTIPPVRTHRRRSGKRRGDARNAISDRATERPSDRAFAMCTAGRARLSSVSGKHTWVVGGSRPALHAVDDANSEESTGRMHKWETRMVLKRYLERGVSKPALVETLWHKRPDDPRVDPGGQVGPGPVGKAVHATRRQPCRRPDRRNSRPSRAGRRDRRGTLPDRLDRWDLGRTRGSCTRPVASSLSSSWLMLPCRLASFPTSSKLRANRRPRSQSMRSRPLPYRRVRVVINYY